MLLQAQSPSGGSPSEPEREKSVRRGKSLPIARTGPLGSGGAAMENVKQLLTSYVELMEKGESAAGWKESVRYFHSAAELADKIKLLSRSTGPVAS